MNNDGQSVPFSEPKYDDKMLQAMSLTQQKDPITEKEEEIPINYYLCSITINGRKIRLDPYRVMDLYGIKHAAHQHAFKKLMRLGHGHKGIERDIDEAIASLVRYKEMLKEDADEIFQAAPAF